MRSPEHRHHQYNSSPNNAKRSGQQNHNGKNNQYALPESFRILPPDNELPPLDPPAAPQPYRLTPTTRRHKNMSFAIVAEPGSRPGSRSPSPSGRVSPFRGRGFNPTGSRHASPLSSPPPPDDHNPPQTPSKIPKLQRRGSATAFGERVLTQPSPTRRKQPSPLNPQLSQSLTNIPRHKPPPAFQRLSPIVGSSPEPTQSRSSPRNSSRSQPQSRYSSPNRVTARPPRNPTRSPNKLMSPTRIPVNKTANYRNVQAKVNSFHRTKAKGPVSSTTTDEVTTTTEDEDNNKSRSNNHNNNNLNRKRVLERKESVNRLRTSSKNNLLNNNINSTTTTSTINKTSTSTNNNNKSGNNNNSNNNNKSSSSRNNNNTNISTTNSNKKSTPISTNKSSSTSTSTTATTTTATTTTVSPVKLSDLLQPSTTAVVSSTTSTVTQPLKIEAKLETDKTISPMVDGRVLSATSVSHAMNKMNDSVLNTQTLMREHAMPKLSPAASTIIAMSQEARALDTKNATSALPSVDTVKVDHGKEMLNHVPARVLEQHVQKNMSRLVSPESNNHVVSVNERIKEARTVVAKPIKITVKEKPMDVEVQSGNIRFDTSNGLNERPGLPPSQNASNNAAHESQEQQNEEQRKTNICTRMFSSCRKKMACRCCKKNKEEEDEVKSEMKEAKLRSEDAALGEDNKKKTGCFNCRRNKPDVTINIEDDEPKKKFWDRLKCCGRNKVGDNNTTGCFSKNKRKDSWTERRDSILSEPMSNQSSSKCSGFLRKIFCINLCCKKKNPPPEVDHVSRRASMMSKKKSLTPSVPHEDHKPKIDASLVEHASHMKGAIPVLPVALAWFCLVMNCIAPGTGTILSGLFCLCIGKPRFSQKDGPKPRIGAFIIDLIIGIGQLFTVLFCLVGWGWSIWWGVIMVRVAKKHQKIKMLEANAMQQEAPATRPAATNQNHHSRGPERRP